MNTWIHNLLQELEDKLKYLGGAEALAASKQACDKLSGYMANYVFTSRAEEILYFKIFKPRFMAHQLKYEILVSGENMDPGGVADWFREYYTSYEKKADGFHFTFRSCRKCDFELSIKTSSPNGWETADKQVARLLVENWFKNVYA
ncbi:MAG: hypothetical protein V4539_10060 [Bacteroidota bacterium]